MRAMLIHSSVGTGAGVIENDNGRQVPVVTLYFAKNTEILQAMEQGAVFNPSDEESWHGFALSIRAARQFVSDLNEAIDAAIQGPVRDMVSKVGTIKDHHWKLWCCEQVTGREVLVEWGDQELIMQRMQERADRSDDVWVIDPDGNKHLPE